MNACRPTVRHLRMDDSKEKREVRCMEEPELREAPAYTRLELYRNCAFFARKFKRPSVPVVKKLLKDLVII